MLEKKIFNEINTNKYCYRVYAIQIYVQQDDQVFQLIFIKEENWISRNCVTAELNQFKSTHK